MHTAEALVANRTHASSASVFVGHTSDIQMKQVIHAAYPIAGNGLAGHDFVDHLTNKSCTGSGLLRHRNLVTKTGTWNRKCRSIPSTVLLYFCPSLSAPPLRTIPFFNLYSVCCIRFFGPFSWGLSGNTIFSGCTVSRPAKPPYPPPPKMAGLFARIFTWIFYNFLSLQNKKIISFVSFSEPKEISLIEWLCLSVIHCQEKMIECSNFFSPSVSTRSAAKGNK